MNDKKGIIYQVIKRKILTFAVVLFIFVFGTYSYITIPKQEYPVISAVSAEVRVTYPGLSAIDMEEMITKKIEEIVVGTPDIKNYSSEIYTGGSITYVTYDDALSKDRVDSSIEKLRIKMENYKNSDMPKEVSEFIFDTHKLETAAFIISFTSNSASMTELLGRAKALKEEIRGFSSIYKAEIAGEAKEQVEIIVDSARLNHTRLNMSDIETVISAQNSLLPIGNINFESDKISINSTGAFNDLKEIEDIIIQVSEETGEVVRLRDIADIKKSAEEDIVEYFYNGKKAILLNVYFKDGINMVTEGEKLREIFETYGGNLPASINMDLAIDLPKDVDKSINNFMLNLVESIVIVLLVIMIGMSLRNGIIVSTVIPFTIFVAFIFMKIMKIDIEFVSLASLIIALGMLVDNAIVVSDAIQVRIDNNEERLSSCVNGTKEIAFPVLSSTLTTVAIYSIFFFLPGTMAEFVSSLPIIVIVSLMTSYVASMLITPLMCYLFIKKSVIRKERKSLVKNLFDKLLQIAFKYKKITLSASFIMVFASLFALSQMNLYLLPNSKKSIIDIDITSSSMNDMRKAENAVKTIEAVIKDMPEIQASISSIGSRVPKYDFGVDTPVEAVNKGNFVLIVDPTAGSQFNDKAEMSQYLQDELQKLVVGAKVKVSELNALPSTSEPVQVKVAGNNLEQLNIVSSIIENELARIDGVKSTNINKKVEAKEYLIDIRNSVLNSLGLTKAEVQNELNLAIMGRVVSNYRKNSNEYAIKLKSNIKNEANIESFKVFSSLSGAKYSVKQFADIKLNSAYPTISRFNSNRVVTVSATVKNGYSPDAIQRQWQQVLDTYDFNDVTLIYEGDSDYLNDIYSRLSVGVVVAVAAIFIILFLQFNSIKQSFIVLISIPYCFIGSTIGLVVSGQNLSFVTMLGIVSLFGVVVNNAIVLVDYINEERKNGSNTLSACKLVIARRFRPIMLSTVTTVLGLLPLVISKDVLFEGMAIAFISGLIASTVFTLIIVPMVYAMWHKDDDSSLVNTIEA